jgi:hypothetical protein
MEKVEFDRPINATGDSGPMDAEMRGDFDKFHWLTGHPEVVLQVIDCFDGFPDLCWNRLAGAVGQEIGDQLVDCRVVVQLGDDLAVRISLPVGVVE